MRDPAIPARRPPRSLVSRIAPVWEVIVAPRRAFETLAERPSWLPAYVVVSAILAASVLLTAPAIEHVFTTLVRTAAARGEKPATDDPQAFVNQLVFGQLTLPVIQWVVAALAAFGFARRTAPGSRFATFFSLAALTSIPQTFGELAQALAVHARPAESFGSFRAIYTALPISLAGFASPGNDRQLTFLANFDPFTLWSALLFAAGLAAIAKLQLTTALVVSFSLTVFFALALA